MRKMYIGAAMMAVMVVASLVWYGCTKDNDSETGKTGIIYGNVSDYTTGEPVINANVTLHPGGETTLTGYDGMFEFHNVKNGDYTLTISKEGYRDLVDSYVIQLRDGKQVRRDVQLVRIVSSFAVMVDGHETSLIDFGDDINYNQIQVTIYNNGTENISEVDYSSSSQWIKLPYYGIGNIAPGAGESFVIEIDRELLNGGNNTGYVEISSGATTKQLMIKAIGFSVPSLAVPTISTQSGAIVATSSVVNTGGGTILDRGFEVKWSPSAYSHDVISLGQDYTGGPFSAEMPYSSGYVRAYAYNGIYEGYSEWKHFPE